MRFAVFLLLGMGCWAFGQITGRVLDQDTMAPIADAVVKIQAREITATTDAGGNFTLNDTDTFPFTVTASKWHFFNVGVDVNQASETVDMILLLESYPAPLTGVEDPYTRVSTPNFCGGCHLNQRLEWLGSPMQKTGLNKWVFDFYNGMGTPGGMNGFVYQRDSVHVAHAPNSDCSACHSPMHWLSNIETAGMGDIGNPTQDMEWGIQCEVCHRAYDVDPTKENFPGVTPESFTFVRETNPLIYGINRDVDFNEDVMRAAYNPILSAQLCAACHEDNVDTNENDDYEDEVTFHETTFSEWVAYTKTVGEGAATCIECHMPVTDDRFMCGPDPADRPGGIRSHDIRGTTPEYLENAVTMSLANRLTFDQAEVQVTIHNDGAGHSVPTGIMIRNVILLVSATDANAKPLTLVSGDTVDTIGGVGDPSEGYYAGLPGKAFYLNMLDSQGNRQFYTEAVGVPIDTRIKAGESYVGTFAFDLNGAAPEDVNVDARLIYRRADRALIDIKGWTATGHDETLVDLEPPHFGHLMEQETAVADPCTADNTLEFLTLLSPFWLQDAPVLSQNGATADMLYFVNLANCL